MATADTGKLTSAALRGLSAIWRGGFSYKKVGIMFLDLVPATEVQAGLFDQPDTPASPTTDGCGRPTERPRWPRYHQLRAIGPTASLEAAERVPLAALHDAVGRIAARMTALLSDSPFAPGRQRRAPFADRARHSRFWDETKHKRSFGNHDPVI